MHDKLRLKLEQLARCALAHASGEEMRRLTGLSQSGVSRILAMPEFRERVAQLEAELLARADKQLQRKMDVTLKTFETAVPLALQGIVEVATQSRDLKAKLAAAAEILDRDPESRALRADERRVALSQDSPAMPKALLDNAMSELAQLAREVAAQPRLDDAVAERLAAQALSDGKPAN